MTKSLLTGALAMALAAPAAALTISFQYDGTASTVFGRQTVVANAFYTSPSGLNASALSYAYSPATTFADGTGSVSLAGGTIEFRFDGTFVDGGVTGGIVRFLNGAGAYAGYGGSGNLAHATVEGDLVTGSFDAEIVPVPEPASLTALAAGAASLLRRRARKVGR